ncbi:acylphosphatase [Companilactobacillus sp. DQM5]|uniref:acylphosphatase n=1 Tax=Companilactobacillus sp. DQM5 TaxID=3463359 RepID=UPI004059C9DC
MKKNISLVAHGIVQGVGFRYFTQQIAEKMSITGTVKNNIDGTVSINAEADETVLDDFIKKIKSGPSTFSKVKKLDVIYNDELKNYTNFSVIG